MVEITTDPIRLPPGPRVPKVIQGLGFITARHRAAPCLTRRLRHHPVSLTNHTSG